MWGARWQARPLRPKRASWGQQAPLPSFPRILLLQGGPGVALPSCLAPHTDGQVGVSLAWVSLSVAGCDALGCPCLAAHLSSARWASELSLPPGQVPGSLVNSSPPQGQVAVWTEQGYEARIWLHRSPAGGSHSLSEHLNSCLQYGDGGWASKALWGPDEVPPPRGLTLWSPSMTT